MYVTQVCFLLCLFFSFFSFSFFIFFFLFLCFFFFFFCSVACFFVGVLYLGRMLSPSVPRIAMLPGQELGTAPQRGRSQQRGSPKTGGWSVSIAQRFKSKQVNVIYGCSGIYHSNAKCCSVLVWLFVMPFSKHKQIDRLAPAAAYDIYTTCMIQHASLGKQACVLSILVLF